MITAEMARLKTKKYTENSNLLDNEKLNKFIDEYKHDLKDLESSIIQSAENKNTNVLLEVYYKDYPNGRYCEKIDEVDHYNKYLLSKLNRKGTLYILKKHFEKLGYKIQFNYIKKQNLFTFFRKKEIGFLFKISWDN